MRVNCYRCTFTRAPRTPRQVSLRYSNGLDLQSVVRKQYKYDGKCAATNRKTSKKIVRVDGTDMYCLDEVAVRKMSYSSKETEKQNKTLKVEL